MRFVCVLAIVFGALGPQVALKAEVEPVAAKAWFTQADIKGVQTAKPADALPDAPGACGKGVSLTKPVPVDDPLLGQQNGYISFWIKPNWSGDDSKTHKLLRIGDPKNNGLLVEKAASGMLRYVMASPKKTTVSRGDVSAWKAGDWHHIAIVWKTLDGVQVGTPLWIDKKCVDGQLASGNEFLNPETMSDRRAWIGDPSSDAVMDELLFRDGVFEPFLAKFNTRDKWSQVATLYRDYFRTAPFTAISIDPDACQVPSDRRVVNGSPKQFGLRATVNGRSERFTENIVRYGNWTDYDAKPFITWSTSDEKVATVDADGKVMGKSVGRCKLVAQFGGAKASYDLDVISTEQSDLDLYCVERTPRYSVKGEKWWPDNGEKVQSIAHIANFGYTTAPAGVKVRFELIPDKNDNFRLDPGEKAVLTSDQVIDHALAPREETTLKLDWTWPEKPIWVRVTVDPKGEVPEICEANNQRAELNYARALIWGYTPKSLEDIYTSKRINMVGSFSYYDWFNGQATRLTEVMHESVYPATSPFGIRDAIRSDGFFPIDPKADFWKDGEYYDGGFPVSGSPDLMSIDSGLIHEDGHTCLALPDEYGYPLRAANTLLKDETGKYYAGTSMLPENTDGSAGSWIIERLKCVTYNPSEGLPNGYGSGPLMSFSHLWLNAANAGQVQFFARYRGDKFWGVHGRLVPALQNVLKVYDVDDKPLANAAVYVYHVIPAPPNAGSKYFFDRPKFTGDTDQLGRFIFPNQTDSAWDDPDTDQVDGAITVWNPFGRVKTDTFFTPNVVALDGLLLIKIVSGDQTELHWLPGSEFNRAFFEGQRLKGTYTIRTSLASSDKPTPIIRPVVPDAIAKTNLKPVAVVDRREIEVKCGEQFTIDGSKSYDPEGQPLTYWWCRTGGIMEPTYFSGPVLKAVSPTEIEPVPWPVELCGDISITFTVCDGVRVSDPVSVTVKVEK